jgi:hypothetical protein
MPSDGNEHGYTRVIYGIKDLEFDLLITECDEFITKVNTHRGDETTSKKCSILESNQQTGFS